MSKRKTRQPAPEALHCLVNKAESLAEEINYLIDPVDDDFPRPLLLNNPVGEAVNRLYKAYNKACNSVGRQTLREKARAR